MNNQSGNNKVFYIGLAECILAIIILIVGIFLVGVAFEDDYSGHAQSGSFILFFLFLWESLLLGVSGFMTMKEKGNCELSITGNLIMLFGDLFWTSKIWLFVICLIIGSVIGMLGLVVGLGTSLTKK